MSAYRGGMYSTSVVLRVPTGAAVCGDKGTFVVSGLDGVLRTSNTGMKGTGEAGLTSQAGKTVVVRLQLVLLRLIRQSGFVGVYPFL